MYTNFYFFNLKASWKSPIKLQYWPIKLQYWIGSITYNIRNLKGRRRFLAIPTPYSLLEMYEDCAGAPIVFRKQMYCRQPFQFSLMEKFTVYHKILWNWPKYQMRINNKIYAQNKKSINQNWFIFLKVCVNSALGSNHENICYEKACLVHITKGNIF